MHNVGYLQFQENSTFVKLSDLACNATFQFKVTPVSGAGVMGRSRETAWITTPSCKLTINLF